MSRSGYSDDCYGAKLNLWLGAVKSAIHGKRGQAMLRELASALDALPVRRLAKLSLVNEDGEFCTLGALGRARGLNMSPIDTDDCQQVARAFGVAQALVAEIMYLNDEYAVSVPNLHAAEQRWGYMRKWVAEQIAQDCEPIG